MYYYNNIYYIVYYESYCVWNDSTLLKIKFSENMFSVYILYIVGFLGFLGLSHFIL